LAQHTQGGRRTITIERTFKATLEEVWDLWTTKNGIESWWGPEGFVTEVSKIDLRPGGELDYNMIAVAPEQIEFLKNVGMSATTPSQVTYAEVVRHRRLAYRSLADFIPGVEPYQVMTTVEFFPEADGVRMVMTFDAMHDEYWTNLAVMGWESELGKLERVLEKSKG
jgi:uncharacterized protein YndB with AHSA1/START domain